MAADSSPEGEPKGEMKEETRTPVAAVATAAAVEASPKTPNPSLTAHEEIKAVARKFADHPIQNPDPGVWAVLTAISKNARQRPQGMNIIFNGDEHCIGRLVEDPRFQIGDIAISANHCRIFREKVASADDEVSPDSCVPAFLKDTSTNGTFLNWKKLRKHSRESRLQHGDIISFVAPPHEENAYAFVYREVCKLICSMNGATLKRKAEYSGSESKRTKGIGIGAADGPVSLADIRSLQRSNMELRKQLESHVLTVEALRSENRALVACHENEVKEVRESVTSSFRDQIKGIQCALDIKQKELDEVSALSAELQNSTKDLNETLSALMQSHADADEVIYSQKARISELESQLNEEKIQRREERKNAAADLKTAVQKAQAEAQEEMKRQANEYSSQNREQMEKINKLQDSEKEIRMQVDMWRSKLDDTRESLNMSQKKVRHLEAQVQEEQIASENSRKRFETAESEMKRLKKELEIEKVAREEAWAKVSALELEIAAAMHELSSEKQRFQGARERVILRETQLRAFYSTTEEITALFAKQQEQLKAMQKTLEDEENCENTSVGFDLNACPGENPKVLHQGDENNTKSSSPKEVPSSNGPKTVRLVTIASSDDDASLTEKHDCDIGSQEEDMECTSAGTPNKAFGSDIDGVGTAPIPEGEHVGTEQVLETESPTVDAGLDGHNIILQKCSDLAGETVPLDDEAQVQDNIEKPVRPGDRNDHGSQSRLEDTEAGTIRTTDLFASELPGSWANSTVPSVHGENDSPNSEEGAGGPNVDAMATTPFFSDGQGQGSQSNPVVPGAGKSSKEHLALNVMIGIVAPELKDTFRTGLGKDESLSDAETEEGSNHSGGGGEGEDDNDNGSVNEDSDVMIHDSVG